MYFARKFQRVTRHGKWMDPVGVSDLASIIIPTYNRAALLSEAIESSAIQTHRPLEIIVADDGSDDDTVEVVNRWRQQLANDPGVDVQYHHQSNSGVSSARNLGLIASRGEFIQFVDSDDILNPEKLSRQIACLKKFEECGYVFSDWAKFEDPDKWGPMPADNVKITDSAQWYFDHGVMMTMVGLYRRDICFRAGPFSEDMNAGEDREFNFRALLATPKVAYLRGKLCAVRTHTGPRLTDSHFIGQNRMIYNVRIYRRIIESADAEGRLCDAAVMGVLVRCLTDVMLRSLEAGRRDIARDAIEVCRMMPVGMSRRVKLSMYQTLSRVPKESFSRVWTFWLKIRRVIFGVPYRTLFKPRNS